MVQDASVLDLLKGNNSLSDTMLIGIVVQEASGKTKLELRFTPRDESEFSEIVIVFSDVLAFDFSYDGDEVFYEIVELKLLKLKDGSFYISLDPDPQTLASAGVAEMDVSETDRFFVRARHLEAVATRKSGTAK